MVSVTDTLPAGSAPLCSLTCKAAVVRTGESLTGITFMAAVLELSL